MNSGITTTIAMLIIAMCLYGNIRFNISNTQLILDAIQQTCAEGENK
jgi:alpha-D-ribose 1-methylphosphonate 5-triphosphate diphosphatase PhnM